VKSPTELAASFRARGLKVTPQRLQIFEVLHGSHEHLTADAVHARVRADMPTVSLRTVYQTLNDLAAMGELVQLDLGTGSTRSDPTVEPHHHLVCDACGRVQDVPAERAAVRVPAGHDHGFEVVSTDVVFRGRCVTCRTDDRSVSSKKNHIHRHNDEEAAPAWLT
jgi:Fe2+ or Zn2+ uptake regulation protein